MKKLFLIASFMQVGNLLAQTHRFIYELKTHNPNLDFGTEAYMVLDINSELVKFYDDEFIKMDSLNQANHEHRHAIPNNAQLLMRKLNTFNNQVFYSHGYDYFVVSSTDKIQWTLTNEIKNMDNHQLQKATTNFGGRLWTAWFNPEIPLQEGPYKFKGLPGLIYEVYDSEELFHYTLVKIQNLPNDYDTSNFLETHYGKPPVPISLEQYHNIKLDYYHNAVEVLKKAMNNNVSIAGSNELSTPEDIDKKKKSIQKNIKNYYVPVEKDKAIPYP